MGPTMLMFDCLKPKIEYSCSIKHELPTDKLCLTTSAVEFEASFDTSIFALKLCIQNVISCEIKKSNVPRGSLLQKRLP